MADWDSSEAQFRFDDIATRALTSGPQRVRVGDQVMIVVSEADYQRLTRSNPR